MNLKVTGPRVLLRVKNFKTKKDQTFEGSNFLMPDDLKAKETVNQCIGEVVALGDTAYKRKDSGCDGTPWVKVGDVIHFSRYGAMRINPDKDEDYEYWIIMDKDVLCIEENNYNG